MRDEDECRIQMRDGEGEKKVFWRWVVCIRSGLQCGYGWEGVFEALKKTSFSRPKPVPISPDQSQISPRAVP